MTSLSYLNKLIFFTFIFLVLNLKPVFSEDETIDIWKTQDNENANDIETINETDLAIKNPILSDSDQNNLVQINENQLDDINKSVIGIFDPEENNFDLNMWVTTDGSEIERTFSRINKLKLSKPSEDILFKVLFTNAYAPGKNLNAEDFLKIKIDWLIKNKRINDLEILLKNNPEVGKNSKAVKFLINEYLSFADLKSACEKISLIDKKIENIYLEKFSIYCLIINDQKNEAQLILDLLRDRGFKDKFFENKINFLLGISEKTPQKILDNNLLNFYLSHITNDNFIYEPTEKTDKYIWRYLSSANLIKIENLEDENVIITYEQAASKNSFENDEIFKIYLKMDFSFNQLANAEEIYKNLPNFKARALIYQSILLSDNSERKIDLAFLLKNLFIKDQIYNVYQEEFSNILKSIKIDEISDDYAELIQENLDNNLSVKVKFDNEILHRSKVIRHFLDESVKNARTEKDLKSVYKKIKKNKKYFISIKDIIVIDSLISDGVSLPSGLDYDSLSSELTVPQNLQDLADQNQIGLVMLKIVEIIGEDNISDLDPETLYFLNKILNDLNLKKIRNSILSQALPKRI
jgi:hypothetical protein